MPPNHDEFVAGLGREARLIAALTERRNVVWHTPGFGQRMVTLPLASGGAVEGPQRVEGLNRSRGNLWEGS
jgi:hypothetical protein